MSCLQLRQVVASDSTGGSEGVWCMSSLWFQPITRSPLFGSCSCSLSAGWMSRHAVWARGISSWKEGWGRQAWRRVAELGAGLRAAPGMRLGTWRLPGFSQSAGIQLPPWLLARLILKTWYLNRLRDSIQQLALLQRKSLWKLPVILWGQ